jgi:phasin family protein
MTATKKPTARGAKRTQRTSAPRKTALRRPATKTAKKSKGVDRIGKVLDGIKLSGAASLLLAGRRKDIDALLKVSRKSYKQVQGLVERRSRELKRAIGDWREAAKDIRVTDGKDAVVKLETIGNEAFRLAVKNLQDLGEVAAKSQNEALDVIKKRIRDNIADVKKLLRK